MVEHLSRIGSTNHDLLTLYLVPGTKHSRLRSLTELVQAVWVDYQLAAKPDAPIVLSFVFLRGLALTLQHSKSAESGMQSLKRALHLEGGEGPTALTSPAAKTIADQVSRCVVKHAEQKLRNMIPTQEAVIRFLIRHDFSDADQHLKPFMPQFEGGSNPVFGLKSGAAGPQRVCDINTLNQALAGLITVVSPFQDQYEAKNFADIARFVQLVPTIMANVPEAEATVIGHLWQLFTHSYNDYMVGTSMPDVPPPEVEGLLQSKSFLNMSSREATRAHVARLVATQTSDPLTAGTPRGAAPGGARCMNVGTPRGASTKRRAEQDPSGAPGGAGTLASAMSQAGKLAFREWTNLSRKFCTELRTPKSTRSPCFFHLCTEDSAGVKCKDGKRCSFQHLRPSATASGQARALYDKVWDSFSLKASLPFAR
jgi:hypothetical protein